MLLNSAILWESPIIRCNDISIFWNRAFFSAGCHHISATSENVSPNLRKSICALEGHPIRGASWETFVIEDVVRREKLRHPHSQFYFWRTAAGVEVDLVIERGTKRFAVEVKAGRGDKQHLARVLEQAAADLKASHIWIPDQAEGTEPTNSAGVSSREHKKHKKDSRGTRHSAADRWL